MGSFDLQKAATMLGGGGDVLGAIGIGFGVPNCVMNLTEKALGMLPSSWLNSISQALGEGLEEANNAQAAITEDMLLESGLLVVQTEDGDTILQSDTSQFGIDADAKQELVNEGSFLNAIGAAIAGGLQLYNQAQYESREDFDELSNCAKQFQQWNASKKGAASLANALGNQYGYSEAGNILAGGYCTVSADIYTTEAECILAGGEWVSSLVDPLPSIAGGDPTAAAQAQFALLYAQLQNAIDFAQKCEKQLNLIGNLLKERLLNPSLEPCLLLAGGGTCSTQAYKNKEDCEDNGGVWTSYTEGIPAEFLEGATICALNKAEYDDIITPPTDLDPSAIFDLVYGPPVSKEGQFILTTDGLYYDSQSGGVPEVIGFVPPADFYKFEQPANLGGKGKPISSADLSLFVSSIFDPNIIDDSTSIQHYYDNDHFLKMLIGERDKHINQMHIDLSGFSVAGSSLAVLENTKQEIHSQLSLHEDKINRRKKQIEVAVKAASLFGSDPVPIGAVPINDFSYLKNLNIIPTLEQQKQITFVQGDVSEVVLPYKPKFVKSMDSQGSMAIQHLLVPTVGTASIIYDASTTGGTSTGTSGTGTLYSLTDEITTDGLLAVYNFLNAEIADPSSTIFGTLNCASPVALYGGAQLIASDVSSTFVSGLSIPKLKGLVKYKSNGFVRGVGSVLKLPDIGEFKDLLYSPAGMSFETWVHIPGLGTSSTSYVEPAGEWGPHTFSRVLLGCENVGGSFEIDNANNIPDIKGLSVRGLLMGFTRDQQLTLDKSFSNTLSDTENPLGDQGFFICPTTSYNASSVGFISQQANDECAVTDSTTYRKLFIRGDTSVSGKTFNDVSSQFMHVCVAFSPLMDTVDIYLDGIKMTTSSMQNVFGGFQFQSPGLPSFKKSNSFEYSIDNIKSVPGNAFSEMDAPGKLQTGPPLNDLFTPWLIGGGYTDGMLLDSSGAGFMGNNHGVKSGLNGFVGSVKLYSRPLNSKEVLKNYKAQQGFFKNIKT